MGKIGQTRNLWGPLRFDSAKLLLSAKQNPRALPSAAHSLRPTFQEPTANPGSRGSKVLCQLAQTMLACMVPKPVPSTSRMLAPQYVNVDRSPCVPAHVCVCVEFDSPNPMHLVADDWQTLQIQVPCSSLLVAHWLWIFNQGNICCKKVTWGSRAVVQRLDVSYSG